MQRTALEKKFEELISECEALITPSIFMGERWYRVSKNQKRTKSVINSSMSISVSFGSAMEEILVSKPYKAMEQLFKEDPVFRDASRLFGHWGTLRSILQLVLVNSGRVTKKYIYFDHSRALNRLRAYRSFFMQSEFSGTAITRLYGVKSTVKRACLPDNIEMIRLNIRELNEREPVIDPYFPSGQEDFISEGDLELLLPVTVPIDRQSKGAYFKTQSQAQDIAVKTFQRILNSILIACPGRARLFSFRFSADVILAPIGQSIPRDRVMPPKNMLIRVADFPKIEVAYNLLSPDSEKYDNTLFRALHRFLLGRERYDLIDKLVDYVICWEAILLTQEGQPLQLELGYRFSLNGASIIAASEKRKPKIEDFKKFKAAYSARSIIVHGGSKEKIDKKLREGSFRNIHALTEFLETRFRQVVFWLADMPDADRPYKKCHGWEEIIWVDKSATGKS